MNTMTRRAAEMKKGWAQNFQKSFRVSMSLYFGGTLILVWLVFQTACSSSQQQPKPSAAVPVTVTKVVAKEMPVEINAIGNVQTVSGVSIRSQVTGRVLKVNFKEGDFVKKGQLLFTIDSRPFVEALKEAQANLQHDLSAVAAAQAALAKDTAQAKYAAVEESRYDVLMKEGVVYKEDGEQFKANADA